MAGVNKVILIGNLGADPEVRHLQNGASVANFRIATTETYKDKTTGEKREQTEWHSIVAWRGLAEITERFLRKGSKVYIEGALRTRKWQDKDGKDQYSTEIIGNEMQMLDSRGAGGGGAEADQGYSSEPRQQRGAASGGQPAPFAEPAGDWNDDIPF